MVRAIGVFSFGDYILCKRRRGGCLDLIGSSRSTPSGIDRTKDIVWRRFTEH